MCVCCACTRILKWHGSRGRTSLISSGDVWKLVSHLDGVMVRCVQKALRQLVRDSHVDIPQLTVACIEAIQSSVRSYEAATDDADDEQREPANRPASEDDALEKHFHLPYWSFSWMVLEELAHSGKLVEAATKGAQENLGVVLECWSKLQAQVLPAEYNEGSKRVLRVVAALAPVIDAQDAQEVCAIGFLGLYRIGCFVP